MDAILIALLAVGSIAVYKVKDKWKGKTEWFWTLVALLIAFVSGEIFSKLRTGKTLTQNLNVLKRDKFWFWTLYWGSLALFFGYAIFGHLGLQDDVKLNALAWATLLGGVFNAWAGRGVKEGESGPAHIRIWLRLATKGLVCGVCVWIISAKWYLGLGAFVLNWLHALPMWGTNRLLQFLRGFLIGIKIIFVSWSLWYLGLGLALCYAYIFTLIQIKSFKKEGLGEFLYGALDDLFACMMAF